MQVRVYDEEFATYKDAVASARELMADRDKLRSAIETTKAAVVQAERHLEGALARLGETQAEALLAGESLGNGRQFQPVQAARSDLEGLQMTLRALEERLAATKPLVAGLADQLRDAQRKYASARWAAFGEELATAAADFSGVLLRGIALSECLRLDNYGQILRRLKLEDPANSKVKLIDVDVRERVLQLDKPGFLGTKIGHTERVPAWVGDEAATALVETHRELTETEAAFGRLLSDLAR